LRIYQTFRIHWRSKIHRWSKDSFFQRFHMSRSCWSVKAAAAGAAGFVTPVPAVAWLRGVPEVGPWGTITPLPSDMNELFGMVVYFV
jgi:hypothetical protein